MQRFIERVWSGKHPFYWCLIPFSLLYGAIAFVRRKAYQMGVFRSFRAPVPVIIVGNLTAGGSGKTPFVIWLVQQLNAKGLRVGVISRGYGGNAAQYPVLLNDDTSTNEAGDEPVLIYQRTRAPVAVSPNRQQAISALLEKNTLDLIISDDGLQHYALARDYEIVIIDGERQFGNGWWIPAGPLREHPSRLKSVDAVVINGGKCASQTAIQMTLNATDAVNIKTGEKRDVTTFSSLIAMAGIGYPTRFFNTLHALNVRVDATHEFNDHQHYTLSMLQPLAAAHQTLLMTEKDAVKCRAFAQDNWWFLPVDAQIDDDKAQQLFAHMICKTKIKVK